MLCCVLVRSSDAGPLCGDLDAVTSYRQSLEVIRKWLLTDEVEETVYRTENEIAAAKNKTKAVEQGRSLFDALVQGLAYAKQFGDAEAVLCFVMKKRPALINAHFFIAPLRRLSFDATTDQSVRFLKIYECAMASAESTPGSNAMKFDGPLAFNVMHAYAQVKDFSGIARTIDRCQRYNTPPSQSRHSTSKNSTTARVPARVPARVTDGVGALFSRLLAVCSKAKKPANWSDLASKIYAMAKQSAAAEESDVSIVTVNTYLHFLVQTSQVGEAERLFRSELKRADTITYTTMINGYAANRMTGPAFDVYRKMIASGLEPNEFTYNALLKACASIGAVGPARQLLQSISDRGIKLAPSVRNAFFSVLVHRGDLHAAEQYALNEMECSKVIGLVDSELKRGVKSGAAGMFTAAEIESCVVSILALLNACKKQLQRKSRPSPNGGGGGDTRTSSVVDASAAVECAERQIERVSFLASTCDVLLSDRNLNSRSAHLFLKRSRRDLEKDALALLRSIFIAAGKPVPEKINQIKSNQIKRNRRTIQRRLRRLRSRQRRRDTIQTAGQATAKQTHPLKAHSNQIKSNQIKSNQMTAL